MPLNNKRASDTKADEAFEMPEDCRTILENQGVLQLYEARPYEQQKGYAVWLAAAARESDREQRIILIVEELRAGVYMAPGKKRTLA